MKKIATSFRCVPRYGYDDTDVRLIDIDLPMEPDEQEMLETLRFYFSSRGIAEAVYDIAVDDDGFFAVINDEVYAYDWGTSLL